jgi:hypothetical protein
MYRSKYDVEVVEIIWNWLTTFLQSTCSFFMFANAISRLLDLMPKVRREDGWMFYAKAIYTGSNLNISDLLLTRHN